MPGLTLGGPLKADASRGTSGVFINGRQLTFGETAYIAQTCQTPVVADRYWVNSQGGGGFEGMAPMFNLALCGNRGGGSGGGIATRRDTYCDGGGACTSPSIPGTVTTGVW